MVLDRTSGSVRHARFSELDQWLPPKSLLVINDFNYDIADVDELSSAYAQDGMGRNDLFWPTIGVAYDVLDNLSVEVGVTALHKAQHDDGSFIFPLFGAMNSLAADNYASWYLDITYMY